MAGADCIAAHGFQDLELAFECPGIDRGAKRAQVVMVADSVKRNPLAVQEEPFLGVKPNGPNAKGGFVNVP